MKTLAEHTQYWPRARRRAFVTGRFHYPTKVVCAKCGARERDVVKDTCYVCTVRVEDKVTLALEKARGPSRDAHIHARRCEDTIEIRRCPLPNQVRAL